MNTLLIKNNYFSLNVIQAHRQQNCHRLRHLGQLHAGLVVVGGLDGLKRRKTWDDEAHPVHWMLVGTQPGHLVDGDSRKDNGVVVLGRRDFGYDFGLDPDLDRVGGDTDVDDMIGADIVGGGIGKLPHPLRHLQAPFPSLD